MDIDSEEETDLHDLQQLTAVLESDEISSSIVLSQHTSTSANMSSLSSSMASDYSKIDTALALNKIIDEKYRTLEQILICRLNECRQKLSEVQHLIPNIDKCEKPESFRYINCGKPYFKDRNNFPAPNNDDAIIMRKSQMYDFSQVTSVPGWTSNDKSAFISEIHIMSQKIREKELNSKIAQLQRELKLKDHKDIHKQILAIEEEIDELSMKTLNELALPIDKEYDWDIIANKLNRRHSAQDYQALWKLFLHPSINKNSWSPKEHTHLQEIAHFHGYQEWNIIAKELNTGRTGYQCFVYFRTNMSNTFTGQKWTKEEEEYLKRLIDYYKEDDYIPWSKVAATMENRTKIQLYNKYFRLTEKRKGRFLPEEDAVILTGVGKFGRKYRKIAEYLPGRSVTQIRVRYQILAKTRLSTVWTAREDKMLVQLMANQDNSVNYSDISKYFPGKTREQLRSRYRTLVKWIGHNPYTDIICAPRRGTRRLGHGQISNNLNKAVEKLKKRMEEEFETIKSKKITINSSEDLIEDAIMDILLNETEYKEENKNLEEEYDFPKFCDTTPFVNVNSLRKMLILLKARLNREQFLKSWYYEEYADLIKNEASSVKVKSYSRKDNTKTLTVNNMPDIWGKNILGMLQYVFPPNYNSITGCKILMDYVHNGLGNEEASGSFKVFSKNNFLLKEQMQILMERYSTLFLWPVLLSAETAHLKSNTPGPSGITHL